MYSYIIYNLKRVIFTYYVFQWQSVCYHTVHAKTQEPIHLTSVVARRSSLENSQAVGYELNQLAQVIFKLNLHMLIIAGANQLIVANAKHCV